MCELGLTDIKCLLLTVRVCHIQVDMVQARHTQPLVTVVPVLMLAMVHQLLVAMEAVRRHMVAVLTVDMALAINKCGRFGRGTLTVILVMFRMLSFLIA